MNAVATSLVEIPQPWSLPYRGKVGMACLIVAESAIFTIFVVAYLFYIGKSLTGPTPSEVLETPIFFTICLLSSSLTVHYAGKSVARGRRGAFLSLWWLTIVLGGLFLFGTGREWQRLIYEHGLTISTNLFGTTYYSLVGLHAFHVTAGLIMLLTVAIFAFAGRVGREQSQRIEVLSLYWHFVDAVWVVVFTVVYIVGR
jgi:cytochrome c oxidase subunit III